MKSNKLFTDKAKITVQVITAIVVVLTFLFAIWMSPLTVFTYSNLTIILLVVGVLISGTTFAYLLNDNLRKPKEKRDKTRLIAPITLAFVSAYACLIAPGIEEFVYPEEPVVAVLLIIFLIFSLLSLLFKIIYDIAAVNYNKKFVDLKEEHQEDEKKVIAVSKKVEWKVRWKKAWDSWDLGSLRYYVLFVGVLAIFYFGVALFSNQFTVPLGGDYTQQTIPFYTNGYDDWWHFFKTGEFPLWDSNTYLGVNNLGSNTFYYAMNPFFLPILLFPRRFIAQGIAILMIAKLILAALAMNKYLQYMGVSKSSARFFGIAYAFCGWNTYYLWFNHFMEVVVVFPLVFYGIEKTLQEKKPWVLALSLALMGITNYFFFVTVCIVGVIYAVFRFFQLYKHYKAVDYLLILGLPIISLVLVVLSIAAIFFLDNKMIGLIATVFSLTLTLFTFIMFYKNVKNERWRNGVSVILLGVSAFAVGIILSTTVLVPGVITAAGSDRVVGASYLDNLSAAFEARNWQTFFDYMLTWEAQNSNYDYQVFYPLISFFFPTVSNRNVTLLTYPYYDNTTSSLFIFTPVMLLLIPSLIQSFKEKKVSHFLALGFFVFALFTPFFYNAFHAFTKEYARWQIFVVFVMIAYIALGYEKRHEWKKYYMDISFILILLGTWLTYLWAMDYLETSTRFTELSYRKYLVYYQFFALFAVYFIYKFAHRSKDKNVTKYVTAFLSVEVIVMGSATMIGHGLTNFQNNVGGGIELVNQETAVMKTIQNYDDDYYRIYNSNAYKGNDNVGMRENYNGLSTFHSLYNFNLKDFNNWSHMNYNQNGWSLGAHGKRYNLDQFLGVKYYVLARDDNSIQYGSEHKEIGTYNVPYGYERVYEDGVDILSTEEHLVFQNTNFVELGSSFTTLMPSYGLPDEEGELGSSYFFGAGASEVVRNEEMYLNYGILPQAEVDEILLDYPEFSVDEYYYTPKTGTWERPKGFEYDFTIYQAQAGADGHIDDLNDAEIGKIDTNPHVIAVDNNAKLKRKQGVIEIKHLDGTPILAEAGQIILELPFKYNARVSLIDSAGEVILFDNHNGAVTSGNFKSMRAYYSDEPVYKIMVMPLADWDSIPNITRLSAVSNDELQAVVDQYTAGGFDNITYDTNHFSFTTNYEATRFAVTHIPYDDGWSVEIEAEDGTIIKPKVYSGQGGFVSFIIPAGAQNIKLSYWTPGLSLGLVLSAIGGALTIGSYGIYRYLKKKDKLSRNLKEVLEQEKN